MGTKVVYKLMIGYKTQPPNPVTTIPFQVLLTITNIGDSVFPGGVLTLFRVATSSYSQSASDSSLQKIQPLNPNESSMLEPHTFTIIEEGVATVTVVAKANDNAQIDFFQNPEYNLRKEWYNLFRIESIEYRQIIGLLEKIVQLLESGEKR